MSRMFYVVIMNLQSDPKGLGYTLFVINQMLLLLVIPVSILEKVFLSINQLQLRNAFPLLLIMIAFVVFDWFYYFREKAQKRITMKYRYEFVYRRPVLSFFLFLCLPFILLGLGSVLIYQNF